MLLVFVFMHLVLVLVSCEDYKENKPYIVVPLPLEFPNRNDRSDQCWLRIEDIEIIDTITVTCRIAQAFLHKYINNYNNRKIIEDKADITPWDELSYRDDKPFLKENKNQNGMRSWKLVTLLDPTTHHRLYVTKNADCKLIMYSREGMTSYKVKCENILYFINVNSDATSLDCARVSKIFIIMVLSFINILIYL